MQNALTPLVCHQKLFVKQVFEPAEIIGFESRNKYRICNEFGQEIAYAAEQQRGFLGFVWRQLLGHWRSFDIHFFDPNRREILFAHHPFRWFFQRLEVEDATGRSLGVIERRFSLLSKRLHVRNPQGLTLMEVNSPIWRIWTFPLTRQGRELARISKKWTGFGFELFTDKDTFLVEYGSPTLTDDERALILVATVYIDLMYFERKGDGAN